MSLVVQTQVFFTIGLAVFFFKENVQRWQLIGALIAVCGLVMIGATKVQSAGGASLGVAFFLVLLAAFFWGAGNTVAKHVARHAANASPPRKIAPMNFIAWTSVASVPALIAISLATEPSGSLLLPFTQASLWLWFHLCVLAYAAQVFGYGLWSNLLTRYPASAVSPFALWVPVAGMSATAWAFGERLSPTQLVGAIVVMIGLATAVLGANLVGRMRRS